MDPETLFRDPKFADLYDHMHQADRADFAFCRALAAATGPASVLDIGCGTGELTVDLAAGRVAVGLDPAAAMLDVARRRPGGEAVRWVEADARTVDLGQRFDLIVLTGHAFQCFLTTADRAALLRNIAAHLTPGGEAVFDSRNPVPWVRWTPEATEHRFADPTGGIWTRRTSVADDPRPGVIAYTQYFTAPGADEPEAVTARLAFPARAEIEADLRTAGLLAKAVHGDWTGAGWTEESPEIVVVAALA